ncbi:MAG: hypothetical protein ABJA82_07265 [Myxococcales bacterium]
MAAAERRLRARVLGNWLVKLELVVSADEADLFMKAVEHARAQISPARAPAPMTAPATATGRDLAAPAGATGVAGATVDANGPNVPPARALQPSAADALVHLVSTYLAGGGPYASAAAPDHCQVVIHLDHALISSGAGLAATPHPYPQPQVAGIATGPCG